MNETLNQMFYMGREVNSRTGKGHLITLSLFPHWARCGNIIPTYGELFPHMEREVNSRTGKGHLITSSLFPHLSQTFDEISLSSEMYVK